MPIKYVAVYGVERKKLAVKEFVAEWHTDTPDFYVDFETTNLHECLVELGWTPPSVIPLDWNE